MGSKKSTTKHDSNGGHLNQETTQLKLLYNFVQHMFNSSHSNAAELICCHSSTTWIAVKCCKFSYIP